MPLTERSQVYRSGLHSILLVLAFALLFFPVSGAAQLGGRPEKSDFTISYTQASGVFAPLWVAHEGGLFKKYGLGTSLKLLNTQVATQALIAGEIDVISTGPNVVDLRLQGAPVKYIGATSQRYIFQLWGVKGLNSLADMKGKTIGVTTPKTATEIATREALKKTGVISDKDVSFIYLQTIPAILTAVMSAKISAGTLSAPNTLKARDAGLTLLLDIGQTNVPGMYLAWGTTDRMIQSYPNSLYAFLKAVAEATVLSKQNPSIAKKAIGKYTNTDDAKIIDETYEQFSPYWDASLVVQVEPIQGHMMYLDEKEFPRLKDARPTDFVDNTFAENLKNSGFLQTLGRAK
jgi:NitT/TauT family transport system substrate-binding protein